MTGTIEVSGRMTATVEVRSQKSRGSSSGRFGGPDTYVTVQITPPGESPLSVLNHKVAKSRGIKLVHCGEGYSDRVKTSRSMLRQAMAEANELADKINTVDTFEDMIDLINEACG